MIPRYTHPEMGGIWSDEHRYQTWLNVEIAAAEAMAAQGLVPAEAARAIRERGGFDVARIEAIEAVTKHDIIAFTTAVAEQVGPEARWLHFGLTSSDVLDTALALQMRDACDLILKRLDALSEAVKATATDPSPHADDRPHARRPRRADDAGAEAGIVVRGNPPRRRAGAPRARGDRRGQDLRRRRHLRPPRPGDRARRVRRARPRSRRPCRRRSSSATATPS